MFNCADIVASFQAKAALDNKFQELLYIYACVAVLLAFFTTVVVFDVFVAKTFTHLYCNTPVWSTFKVTQCAFTSAAQGNVTVVSTKLVVNPLSNTVASAFGSINSPLGLPALSVSILTPRFTPGDTNFLNASFNVLLAVPLQNTGILTLVLSAVSHIACTGLFSTIILAMFLIVVPHQSTQASLCSKNVT
jgi:hypothetical protein